MNETATDMQNAPEIQEGASATITALIRKHPFTAGLSDAAVAIIAGCAQEMHFVRDDYLIREGAHAENFYLLRQGRVALETTLQGRGPMSIQTIGAGEFLGASWLVPPYRWSYDARAATDIQTLKFDTACLKEKFEADPAIGYALMKCLLVPLVNRLQKARAHSALKLDDWHHRSR